MNSSLVISNDYQVCVMTGVYSARQEYSFGGFNNVGNLNISLP